MAIYHLHAKTIGRSDGRSATAAAAYRAGIRIVDARTGQIFDYTRKRGVDGTEILSPDPGVSDRSVLWNAVESSEKRVDAQLAREIEVALPRDLPPEQMRQLVRVFVQQEFVSRGMIADVAFHHLGGANPHAHILLTLREWGEEGFGLKRRDWNDRTLLHSWREQWSVLTNDALVLAGSLARIDHRSLVDQMAEALDNGDIEAAQILDRLPTIHERGSPSAVRYNEALRRANADRSVIGEPAPEVPTEKVSSAEVEAPSLDPEQSRTNDEDFRQEMRRRRDRQASRWRFYDDQMAEAAAWLEDHVEEGARRLEARDKSARRLQIEREARRQWLDANPFPPFWRFWRRPSWRRRWAEACAPVSAAKQISAAAKRLASPGAITALRAEMDRRRTEYSSALANRRTYALLPSESFGLRADTKAPPEPEAAANTDELEPAVQLISQVRRNGPR